MNVSTSLLVLIKAVLVASLLTAQEDPASNRRKCAEPQAMVDSTYKPGQVWSYKSRPGEGSSTITILRVEALPKIGVIVHVRIDGVHLKNCTGGPAPTTVEHAPFTRTAIDKSVTRQLMRALEMPDFEAGYKDWLAHCGGVYTISVAETIDADETTFNAGLACKT